MAQQDLRYYLNGMLLLIEDNKLTLVATDTHRLGITSIDLDGNFEKSETIVPRKTVLELIRQLEDSDKPVIVEIYPKRYAFVFGCCTGLKSDFRKISRFQTRNSANQRVPI